MRDSLIFYIIKTKKKFYVMEIRNGLSKRNLNFHLKILIKFQ